MSHKRGLDKSEPNNDKRQKASASKVLHVRNFPPFVTEGDLINLVRPFGNVVRTLVLQAKGQAFLQMETVDQSTNAIRHFAAMPAFIGGRNILFEYSNRDEVQVAKHFERKEEEVNTTVVLATIHNMRIPVTIENLYQVFSPYGSVLKIITFTKANNHQALVQMDSVNAAISAKLALEGKDIFQGCCTLQIGFSKLTELDVKENSARSRDFTAPFDPNAASAPAYNGSAFSIPSIPSAPSFPPQIQMPSFGSAIDTGSPVLLVYGLPEDRITPDALFVLFGVYGDVIRVKILYNKKDNALVQFATSHQALTAQTHLNHAPLYGKEITVQASKFREVKFRPGEQTDMTKDYTDSALHRFRRNVNGIKHICSPSEVLFLSNLPANASKEELLKIFGEDAVAVQIFKEKMAYVKMVSTAKAIEALIQNHNLKYKDRYIRVSFSQKDPNLVKGDE